MPQQDALDGKVFVESFPMETVPATNQLHLQEFVAGCMRQSRRVGQWSAQLAAIFKQNPEVVGVKPDLRK